jgi:hypothetical protein
MALKRKDGESVDVEVSARMMQVGDGQLFQCNLKDLTFAKKFELAWGPFSTKV